MGNAIKWAQAQVKDEKVLAHAIHYKGVDYIYNKEKLDRTKAQVS